MTTPPIEVQQGAVISQATVSLVADSTQSASLVLPDGTVLPMVLASSLTDEFVLPASSAAALVGKTTGGRRETAGLRVPASRRAESAPHAGHNAMD